MSQIVSKCPTLFRSAKAKPNLSIFLRVIAAQFTRCGGRPPRRFSPVLSRLRRDYTLLHFRY